MKMKTFPILTALAALTSTVHAGQVPDVVWRTNAHNGYGLYSVAFAPDSRSVFSCSTDARQWRVSDTNLLRTFVIPNQEVSAIAVSPDGTRLVGWSANRGFRMWRVMDGVALYSSFAGGSSLAFSPIDNFIARGTFDGGVALLPVNGEVIGGGTGSYDEVHSDGVTGLAFSPDGSLLLTSGMDSTAKLVRVDPANRGVEQEFEHRLSVTSVAFSPSGQVIATGVHDGDVRLWNTNGTLLHTLAVAGSPTRAMDFSPDGKLLATASGGVIQFWRVSDGAHLVTYDPDPGGSAATVDISPDGRLFAYGGAHLVVARMPLLFTEVSRAGNQLTLGWSGGSGLYQLQSTTNMIDGPWQNVGAPTASTAATNAVTSTIFYRVQSLPNP